MKPHALALCLLPLCARAQNRNTLPAYTPVAPISGTIRSSGSPQMSDLMRTYEAAFRRFQPGILFVDELQSTLTAVAGVYTGRADIGLLGRDIWPAEMQSFRSTTGHDPTLIAVATGAYDVPKATFALMVFVPAANPIRSLSTAQLERIFAAPTAASPRTWGDLGLSGAWATRPIHLYGFTTENDKSQIFAKLIFRHAEPWNPALHELANEPAGDKDAGQRIVDAVAQDAGAIGISNIHYATPAVRALPLSQGTSRPIAPNRANVADRTYPLTRSIYFVLDRNPSPAVTEFIRFVLSREGAACVQAEGEYVPLTPKLAREQQRALAASK